MLYKEVMAALFDFNATTYYAWKKQKRPIINLLEQYFSKDDLEEFLADGKIVKLELLNSLRPVDKIATFLNLIEGVSRLEEGAELLGYLSFCLANFNIIPNRSSKNDFILHSISEYDSYPYPLQINSVHLQKFISAVQNHYEDSEWSEPILFHLHTHGFLPLVQICSDNQKSKHLKKDVALFCVYFNLYKYHQNLFNFGDIFENFDFENFDFEELVKKIEMIKRS